MIISKEVKLTLGSKNYTFIKKKYELDDSLSSGDSVMIPIEVLSKGSHLEIDISCDYCGKELKVPYKRYNLNTKVVNKYACSDKECSNQKIKDVCMIKYNVENPFQAEFVKDKSKSTLQEKYGVDHQMHLQATKDKIKETCMDRYGVDSYNKTEECLNKIKETNLLKYGVEHLSKDKKYQEKRKINRIKKGTQIPDEMLSKYQIYRRNVVNLTLQIRKEVISKWDGHDYYDGEYIKDNFNLHQNNRDYPQLDHKISIVYGLINNIPPEEIANISNICITKQYINSLKRGKCENEFILNKKDSQL